MYCTILVFISRASPAQWRIEKESDKRCIATQKKSCHAAERRNSKFVSAAAVIDLHVSLTTPYTVIRAGKTHGCHAIQIPSFSDLEM